MSYCEREKIIELVKTTYGVKESHFSTKCSTVDADVVDHCNGLQRAYIKEKSQL